MCYKRVLSLVLPKRFVCGIEAILLLLNELNDTKIADTSEISTKFN